MKTAVIDIIYGWNYSGMIERMSTNLEQLKKGKKEQYLYLENDSGMDVQVSYFGALNSTIMFPDKERENKGYYAWF